MREEIKTKQTMESLGEAVDIAVDRMYHANAAFTEASMERSNALTALDIAHSKLAAANNDIHTQFLRD